MDVRIAWVNSSPDSDALAPLWGVLRQQLELQLAGRASLDILHLSQGFGGVRALPNRLLNDASMLAVAVASADRFDTLCLGCWAAPTGQVRAALEIPVSSIPEAAARLVGSFAHSPAVVTVAASLIPIFEWDLRLLDGDHLLRAGGVYAWSPETTPLDLTAVIDDPRQLIAAFEAAAVRAVAAGADAIVVGCAYLAAIFAAHDYGHLRRFPDVPVIDCNALAIEHTLLMSRLHRSGTFIARDQLSERQMAGIRWAADLLGTARLSGEGARS